MGRMTLPRPDQIDTIKQFLTESSGLFVEGVEFGRPSSGISMKATYRDFYGHSQTKTILAPDTDDFQNVVVAMSDWLEQISGLALQRLQLRKERERADA